MVPNHPIVSAGGACAGRHLTSATPKAEYWWGFMSAMVQSQWRIWNVGMRSMTRWVYIRLCFSAFELLSVRHSLSKTREAKLLYQLKLQISIGHYSTYFIMKLSNSIFTILTLVSSISAAPVVSDVGQCTGIPILYIPSLDFLTTPIFLLIHLTFPCVRLTSTQRSPISARLPSPSSAHAPQHAVTLPLFSPASARTSML